MLYGCFNPYNKFNEVMRCPLIPTFAIRQTTGPSYIQSDVVSNCFRIHHRYIDENLYIHALVYHEFIYLFLLAQL